MKYDTDVVKSYYAEVGLELTDEYVFSTERNFRFDFVHLPSKTAIEVQGGVWLPRGGHTSGKGYTRDIEKDNLALTLGYKVMKCLPQDICMEDTRETFRKIVEISKDAKRNSEYRAGTGRSVVRDRSRTQEATSDT